MLERAAGGRLADLLSEHLWQPMGAGSNAMITVDRAGTARAAGGMSATARDLALTGELIRQKGQGLLPAAFVDDLWAGGSRDAWKNGDQASLFPGGSYRNYWYETGQGELAAIGIHGQWIWVDPATATVIVKLSSQTLPVDAALDQAIVSMLRTVSRAAPLNGCGCGCLRSPPPLPANGSRPLLRWRSGHRCRGRCARTSHRHCRAGSLLPMG